MGLRDGFNYMDGSFENRFRQQYLCIEPTCRQKQTEHTVGNEMIGEQNYHFYTVESLFPQNRPPWSPQLLWIFHKTYGVPLKNSLKSLSLMWTSTDASATAIGSLYATFSQMTI